MAGTNSGFDATGFKNAIRSAMVMGQPSDPSLQVTFRWPERTSVPGTGVDPSGRPYDWTSGGSAPVRVHDDVQVPAAVKLGAETGAGTDVGRFSTAVGTLTLLDDDYAKVKGATEVLISGRSYQITSILAEGLFDVTVYSLTVAATS